VTKEEGERGLSMLRVWRFGETKRTTASRWGIGLTILSLVGALGTFGTGAVFSSEPKLSIENVQLDRTVLRPGEAVTLSFYLSREAKVSVLVYGPNYEVVRRLMDDEPRPRGTNQTIWDGRDDSGRMVPDEAYLISISAESPDGDSAHYDPTTFSGGEAVEASISKVEGSRGQYRIFYSLPAPSRISIRAGIQRGPLLKTVLDQVPKAAGDHVESWDGMDDTGRISVMDHPKRMIQVSGYLLPKGSILVEGSGTKGDGTFSPGAKSALAAVEKPGVLSFQRVRQNAMKRADRGVAQQFLVRQALNVAPKFQVRLREEAPQQQLAQIPVPTVSGEVGLTVEVAPESLSAFNELRYEIVVFVDNERFDEEEQAYPSHTYVLDTRRLSNGEHLVTINLVSMTGQMGSYSFRINVAN